MLRPRRFERIYDVVEPVEEYRSGGYHPVDLEDVLHSKYMIVRKLGYGQFSTVWLARDQNTSKYVALKILKADNSTAATSTELNILREVRRQIKLSCQSGAQHVLTLLDSFYHKGPNGIHLCLVFSVIGGDAQVHARFLPQRSYSMTVSKSISKQVTQGLHFLHDCGIVHGDLQPGNIIFAVSDDDIDWALKHTDTIFCDVKWLNGVEPDDCAPKYLVVPEPIYDRSLLECRSGHTVMAKIADFGGAVWSNQTSLPIVPRALRAPELIWGQSSVSGVRTDIWSLGCLIFELVTGEPVFCLSLFGSTTQQINQEHQRMIEEIIKPKLDRETATMEFARYLEKRTHGRLGENNLAFARLLRQSMLIVEPEHRKGTGDLLEDPWFEAI